MVSCCVYKNSKKLMLHMHAKIPESKDCLVDPVVHLYLLMSSMHFAIKFLCYNLCSYNLGIILLVIGAFCFDNDKVGSSGTNT